MVRDVSWHRMVIALLVGCAVFAIGKLAFGFQISIRDVIGTVIFMAVVFGLASLILVFLDKVQLKPTMSSEQREVAIKKRSNRLHRRWVIALLLMALVALPIHVFGLEPEPTWQRVLYSGLAVLIVISFLLGWYGSRNQRGLDERGDTRNDEPDSC